MKSYKDLEIYELALELALKIRANTLKLDTVDKFEVGSQIRRSSQAIKDSIVEGYGRRKYKADFIRFLIYSQASLLEARSQAEFLAGIYPNQNWEEVLDELDLLGSKIFSFIKYVETNWKT